MAASDLTVGAVIGDGRYRLERPLGSGGMAVVWLATDERLQRPVAVKVLSDVLAHDSNYIRRFDREARIAAQLSHPNLVRLFDYSADAPRPFLVMEYVEGTTLAQVLEVSDSTRDLSAERLARELLGALEYIHAAGIVHRDVKPANVLVDRTGRVKLTDFGIAQAADASRLTQTGNVMGTLRYIAPEVMEGHQASARSDLYACGVVLREAVRTSPSDAVERVAEVLASPDPDARPESAQRALGLLEQPSAERTATPAEPQTEALQRTGPTAALTSAGREHRPAGTEPQGRTGTPRGARMALALAVAVAVAIALAVLSAGDGSEDSRREEPAPRSASPTAPLDAQLRSLEQGVEDATR